MYKKLLLGILLLSTVIVTVFISALVWTDKLEVERSETIDKTVDETANEINNETNTLEPVEIKEYEGQMLSSIDDFRENSIKGPQYINEESYELAITGLANNPLTYTYDVFLMIINITRKLSRCIVWKGGRLLFSGKVCWLRS